MDTNRTKPPISGPKSAEQPPPPAYGQWTTGLYDCFDNQPNCNFLSIMFSFRFPLLGI